MLWPRCRRAEGGGAAQLPSPRRGGGGPGMELRQRVLAARTITIRNFPADWTASSARPPPALPPRCARAPLCCDSSWAHGKSSFRGSVRGCGTASRLAARSAAQHCGTGERVYMGFRRRCRGSAAEPGGALQHRDRARTPEPRRTWTPAVGFGRSAHGGVEAESRRNPSSERPCSLPLQALHRPLSTDAIQRPQVQGRG